MGLEILSDYNKIILQLIVKIIVNSIFFLKKLFKFLYSFITENPLIKR